MLFFPVLLASSAPQQEGTAHIKTALVYYLRGQKRSLIRTERLYCLCGSLFQSLCTSACVVFAALTPATVKSQKTNKGRKLVSLVLLQTRKHPPQHENTANCVGSTINCSEADLEFRSWVSHDFSEWNYWELWFQTRAVAQSFQKFDRAFILKGRKVVIYFKPKEKCV